MLLSALRTGDVTQIMVAIFASLFLVFCVIPLHEFAHALIADKLGDDTPRLSGGLTLDPLAHIDVLGGLLIALIGFGWGKPTPVNPNNFKKPKRDLALVAAAGPLANLILGFIFVFLSVVIQHSGFAATNGGIALYYFFVFAARITVYLGVLNLLPIPMFDGFNILQGFLSNKALYWVQTNQRTIMLIIMLLLITNILSWPITFLGNGLLNFFYWVSGLIF